MSFIRYTRSEAIDVVDEKDQFRISKVLTKLGKKSVADLTESEMQEVRFPTDNDPED